MKLRKIAIAFGVLVLLIGLTIGWKKTNGFCHEALEYSGCINSWERVGTMYKLAFDPCRQMLSCKRTMSLACGYTQTDEYKKCRSDYEKNRLQPESLTVLVTIEASGGLCMENTVCGSKTVIRNDGSLVTNDGQVVMLPTEIGKLQKLITKSNVEKLKTTKFTGTCPIAYDGQEVVYKFAVEGVEERISSCEFEIPTDSLLMNQIDEILKSAGATD